MKKYVVLLIIIGVSLLFTIGLGYLYYTSPIKIKETYTLENHEIYVTLTISRNAINPVCITDNEEIKADDYTCTFKTTNEERTVRIKSDYQEKEYTFSPNMNTVLDFTPKIDTFYLAINGEEEVAIDTLKLGNPNETFTLKSQNEEIASVQDKTIKGVSVGTTKVSITLEKITKEVNVYVTDLIQTPRIDTDKSDLPCGIYSEEQNQLLDTILESRITNAGYATRAGVVAALRFLTLEFPYQINYFFENGRLNNNTGGAYVDGEGRFYHKGLYLHSSKFQELVKTAFGPATWGCPLLNWQDESGFVRGVRYPNGLDCSGFITWAMYNAGFDVTDTGAGDNDWTDDDLSDLGVHQQITRELLESQTIKAGDIIGTDGHIAMVGGVSDGYVFVAESTTYYDGVVMYPYTYDELLASPYLTYVINMDEYYKEEGLYQAYWE